MLQFKYVIIKGIPIIFGNDIRHKEMLKLGEVESAGFVAIGKYQDGRMAAYTYGESTGLEMQPNPERDERIIEGYLHGQVIPCVPKKDLAEADA